MKKHFVLEKIQSLHLLYKMFKLQRARFELK